jgi:pentatricopeptide repeat protein
MSWGVSGTSVPWWSENKTRPKDTRLKARVLRKRQIYGRRVGGFVVKAMFAARALRSSSLLRTRLLHSSIPRCAIPAPSRRLTATEYAVQLMAASNSGHFEDSLQLAQRMKVDGIKPEAETYNILLSLAARERAWLFAWAIFDDMILAGIKPTPTTFVHLIQVFLLRAPSR